jgi:hypothetical protein
LAAVIERCLPDNVSEFRTMELSNSMLVIEPRTRASKAARITGRAETIYTRSGIRFTALRRHGCAYEAIEEALRSSLSISVSSVEVTGVCDRCNAASLPPRRSQPAALRGHA